MQLGLMQGAGGASEQHSQRGGQASVWSMHALAFRMSAYPPRTLVLSDSVAPNLVPCGAKLPVQGLCRTDDAAMHAW